MQIELFANEGEASVASSSTPVDVGAATETATEARLDVQDITLWSAEQPTLYVVVITLRDADGRTLDCESTRVGFR